MRLLAAAYAVFVALAMPAILWAAEDAPPATTTTPTPTATTPAPATTPAQPPPTTPTELAPAPSDPAPAQASSTPSAKGAADEPRKVEADVARSEPVARTAASGGVTIEDFAFAPRTITIDAGDTVTWTNRDEVVHTATADDGSFDTGNIGRGQRRSETFDDPGTYPYHCTPHPEMTATVVVRDASAGDSSGNEPTATPSGSSGSSGSFGSTLPATGLQVGIVALGGVLLLAGGALLRRRLEN